MATQTEQEVLLLLLMAVSGVVGTFFRCYASKEFECASNTKIFLGVFSLSVVFSVFSGWVYLAFLSGENYKFIGTFAVSLAAGALADKAAFLKIVTTFSPLKVKNDCDNCDSCNKKDD